METYVQEDVNKNVHSGSGHHCQRLETHVTVNKRNGKQTALSITRDLLQNSGEQRQMAGSHLKATVLVRSRHVNSMVGDRKDSEWQTQAGVTENQQSGCLKDLVVGQGGIGWEGV